jgi:aspartokinase-like uncharacterized kinase
VPDVIVKVGGGLLSTAGDVDLVLAAIPALARSRRVLVVPGGGPFADTVRAVDRELGIPADAAHWMAVLAMDQYAHLLAARLDGASVVSTLDQARSMFETGKIPVLAPSHWLQNEDPLPHTWDITSDSIAAWIAGASGAHEIILVKPRGATGCLVDACFTHVVPRHLETTVVPVDQVDAAFGVVGQRK